MQQESLQGFRLSPQQERLWDLQKGDAAQPVLRAACRVSIAGPLDPAVLASALRAVVDRHEILRTTFRALPGMHRPLQVVGEAPPQVLERCDPADLESPAPPFDLERGPVLRARLAELSPHRHVLRLDLPALCADAVSLQALVRDVGRWYGLALRGEHDTDESTQYADIAEWLNDLLESGETREGRQFWQDLGAPGGGSDPRLPIERPAIPEGIREPRVLSFPVAPDLLAGMERCAEAGGSTAPVVALSAWVALLRRLAGRPDVTVGVVCDGRRHEELAGAPGLLAKHLPLRCAGGDEVPAGRFIQEVGRSLADLVRWQEFFTAGEYLPYVFAWQELPQGELHGGVSFSIDRSAACIDRFRLELSCVRRGEDLGLELHYDPEAFGPEDVERLAGWYASLLGRMVESPQAPVGALEILSAGELQHLLSEVNDPGAGEGPGCTLVDLFERQAERSPHQVALCFQDRRWTYGDLAGRVHRLARRLRELGVGPEVRVALCVERSAEMVVGILGILEAGGAYVPLDPSYPRERLAFMWRDSQAAVLVTRTRLWDAPGEAGRHVLCLDREAAEIAARSGAPLDGRPGPDGLAYVIYTSGSTGRPKGVMIAHRAIANRLVWMQEEFPLGPGDAVLQKTPFSFDASIWEIFLPLMTGARLVVAEPGGHQDAGYLRDVIRQQEVTVLQLVPSMLSVFLEQEELRDRCRSLRWVFCGGEAFPRELAQRFWERLPGVGLCNLYGPTEAAIDASFQVCRPDLAGTLMPIGRPLRNVQIHLLDQEGRLVAPGLPGELCIGGAGLGRGYLEQPEKTAERFVPHAWSQAPGARLYRTGDLARRSPGLPDGAIEFLGRIDSQVKVRGFRIELGEIEAVLRQQPGVRDAVVAAREDTPGERSLVGYVVLESPPRKGLHALPGGLEVACLNANEADVVYREIFEEGYLRQGIALEDGACVFDVGANIGLFTLYLKQRLPRSRIYAFEPIPPTFEALRTNTALYGLDAKLFECGLSERSGWAQFTFYPNWSAMSGAYADDREEERITRRILENREGLVGEDAEDLLAGRFRKEVFQCRLKTLSEVIREEGIERIDLLKIDVEKSELDVLSGLADGDWEKVRQIVVEVHDLDGRLERVCRLLEARGFRVAVEQEDGLRGTELYNLYAVHPSRAEAGGPAEAGAPAPLQRRSGVTMGELREHLSARLPDYMVPSALVALPQLPRLPNGKLDRASLPSPDSTRDAGPETASVAPRNPTEELLAGIWADVLGLQRVGVRESFFQLGGHSLAATRVVSRIREAFAVELRVRRLFEAPTIAELAAEVDAAQGAGAGLLAPPLAPASRDGRLPLSFAQQRLWFVQQLEPESPAYNLSGALRLSGRLAVPVLARSISEVVRRHESLRTTFAAVDGEPVQVIHPVRPYPLALADLSGLPAERRESVAQRLIVAAARRPFDLSAGPLLRLLLVRLDDAEHVLFLSMHHVISDGWSTGLLVRELTTLYAAFSQGRPSPLPELPLQYADFAVWQRRWLEGEVLAAQLAYWKRQLQGAPDLLRLPTDRPRPAVPSRRGAGQTFELPSELGMELEALARRQGCTLFMVLLAAFQTLLHRWTGQDDIVVGSPISYRNWAEIEDLIGFFINNLVLRTDLSGDLTFTELLARVRRVSLDAFTHQHVPFEKLVEELASDRSLGWNPLFQVAFSFHAAPGEPVEVPGLAVGTFQFDTERAQFDLNVSMTRTAHGLVGRLQYSKDLFDEITMTWLRQQYELILARVASRPDLRLSELGAILDEMNDQRWGGLKGQFGMASLQSFKERKRRVVTGALQGEA